MRLLALCLAVHIRGVVDHLGTKKLYPRPGWHMSLSQHAEGIDPRELL